MSPIYAQDILQPREALVVVIHLDGAEGQIDDGFRRRDARRIVFRVGHYVGEVLDRLAEGAGQPVGGAGDDVVVTEFGPLVTCYPVWCVRRKSRLEESPSGGLDEWLATRPLLYWSYYARFLWESWTGNPVERESYFKFSLIVTGFGSDFFKARMKEAAAYYDIPLMSGVPPRFPAPIALYVWAARMITDLHHSPGLPRCQAFLRDCLNMLSLYPRSMAKGKGMTLSVTGELIDILAYYAAFRNRREGDDIKFIPGVCRGCEESFVSADGRNHYCEDCRQNSAIQNAIWQRDHRARRKRESQPG